MRMNHRELKIAKRNKIIGRKKAMAAFRCITDGHDYQYIPELDDVACVRCGKPLTD